MRQVIGLIAAFIIAALLPAIYFGILAASLKVAYIAFIFALAFVAFLGAPAFFLLQYFDWVRAWTATLAGFVLGAIPTAIGTWPYDLHEGAGYAAWDGQSMVQYIIDGVPTRAGWVQYLQNVCGVGLIGAISAFAFWLVWRFGVVRIYRVHTSTPNLSDGI